jgi:HD-GYP domain-containing protein (c-di-GMP phosphodiesterase class II)
VRAAEVVASLSLATDLAMGLPLEHGLHTTLAAMRLGDELGVDRETATQTYYACLLFYVGCTADAEIVADIFPDEAALLTHFTPVMFGSPLETMAGVMRALATPGSRAPMRAAQIARRLPKAMSGYRDHVVALCEVAEMLTERLGLPTAIHGLFRQLTERWDGKGEPGRARGEEIPLPLRIVHVARDAAFQSTLGGQAFAAGVIRRRAGGAFDPAIAERLAAEAHEILAVDAETSAWEATLACEPTPHLMLDGEAVDRALSAIGDFADLVSPYLAGHSSGVAELATAAAERCHFRSADVLAIRRAAFVHDVGRAAVPARIWQKPGVLTADEWERVRLHAYHSERVLSHSPFLAALAPTATAHHERLDGSGYHRGAAAAALTAPVRVLAAADAYHAMTEPRPHRAALPPVDAAAAVGREVAARRLDAESVAAVLEAAGQRRPHIDRPAGLTEREAQVVGLLARGLQTKQIARALGISAKTADRHIQNAYAKIGVSTRAAAAVFAMEHGLVTWGELPIGGAERRA